MRRYLLALVLGIYSCWCSADSKQAARLDELVGSSRALRALIQLDPHRPIYHFVAPEGHALPFDPNGALYWKGKYHLGYIYQHQANGKRWNVWGHAVSTDLLHWTIYPDMLDVRQGDVEKGIASGGAFLSKDNVPHVIYYGREASATFLARAIDDDLKVWKKVPENPVLKAPTPVKDFACCITPDDEFSVHDPEAWYDEKAGYYYQMTGGMKPGLFKSADMYQWRYLGSAINSKDSMRHPIEDIACPDFFSLGKKSMLVFASHAFGAQYYIGTFADDKFTPKRHGRMNWPGGTFFAPEQLQDDNGRNIVLGWVIQPRNTMRGWRIRPRSGTANYPDYGWSGVMSLPRVVSFDDGGELRIEPIDEMRLIRSMEVNEEGIVLAPNQERTLRANGRAIEVKMELAGGRRAPFGIKVFASPDGREETVIRYEPQQEQLVIDFERSSINGPTDIEVISAAQTTDFFKPVLEVVSEQRAPLKLAKGETLKLNVFVDRSIIEVFANGRQVMTQVVYPELESSSEVRIFSGEEAIAVDGIQSWTMAATNAY